MKSQDNKNFIAAIILGLSFVLSAYIYACSTRYESHPKFPNVVIDKWKGEIIVKKIINPVDKLKIN